MRNILLYSHIPTQKNVRRCCVLFLCVLFALAGRCLKIGKCWTIEDRRDRSIGVCIFCNITNKYLSGVNDKKKYFFALKYSYPDVLYMSYVCLLCGLRFV